MDVALMVGQHQICCPVVPFDPPTQSVTYIVSFRYASDHAPSVLYNAKNMHPVVTKCHKYMLVKSTVYLCCTYYLKHCRQFV